MSDEPRPADPAHPADLPRPVVRGRRRQDTLLIWLVPIVAALAGMVLVVRSWQSAGPSIDISFKTAEGLDETTTVKFKNVVVGTIEYIRLSSDRENVIVRVNLSRDVEDYLVEDTRFWVERPRVDLGGISGLNTLVSGAYIGMDVGTSEEPQREFVGLEVPPPITNTQKGLRLELSSFSMGSLSIGSPIYLHQLRVGRIVGYDLDADGKAVTLQGFVDAPYDRYVNVNTRFWNVSGVNVTLDANGLQVNTQSLLSILSGGIAFEPSSISGVEPAPQNSRFLLYASRDAALPPPEGPSATVRMRFFQSVRGLAAGAPVEFNGVGIGEVTSIALDYDRVQHRAFGEVIAEIFPDRLGRVQQKLGKPGGKEASPEETLRRLLEHGMRAQLRSGSLITGQLYVALELPDKPTQIKLNADGGMLEIVTVAGGMDQILNQIGELVQKLNTMPFGDIGKNLSSTLKSADGLLLRLDTELAPEAKKTLSEVRATLGEVRGNLESGDASLVQDAQATLGEVSRAARSLRLLGDYLQRHPDALLRGKADADEPEFAGDVEKKNERE